MTPAIRRLTATAVFGLALGAAACGAPMNTGTPGDPAVRNVPITGTIFTIVFENQNESNIIGAPTAPYFTELAHTYASAAAYVASARPSLPNYITMTSGQTYGIADDNAPAVHPLSGTENLGDQLDAASVPWRAYLEDMGEPCRLTDNGNYAVKHNPFVYYTSMSSDQTRCRDRVVDFEQNFATDLAANHYRYMWITPNLCNDMHDCSAASAEAFLRRVVPQIQASPGYQNGGAIFILFDEGNNGPLAPQSANVAAIVISPRLVSAGYRSNTTFDHRSYLATVEDTFGLPRLATTSGATPMTEFFASAASSGTSAASGASGTGTGSSSTGSSTTSGSQPASSGASP